MLKNLTNVIKSVLNSEVTHFNRSLQLRKSLVTNFCSVSTNLRVDNTLPEDDKLYSKLEIKLRGVDPAVLKSYAWFTKTAAEHLNIDVGHCWAERKAHHDRLTLLKCVHIYKKHRVQYEIRTYFRYINLHKLTASTMDTFLEYIERNLPEGVLLEAQRVEIQKVPDHLKEPPKIDNLSLSHLSE